MSTAHPRRQSSRPTRTATSRPTNYYARPLPSARSGLTGSSTAHDELGRTAAPGFFPALTHFTGSVTTLPKEVMKHFSMLKEVEAKVYGSGEELGQLVDAFLGLTSSRSADTALVPFTTNPSFIDGAVPNRGVSYNASMQLGARHPAEDLNASDNSDLERRKVYQRMRFVLHDMSMLLDEKNAVLSSANQTLAKQLARMESSYNYVPTEVSDEVRLGSTTHWAYTDKDAGKAMVSNDRVRRDGAQSNAASTMAAAAAAANNDAKLAASRSEARREAMIAKRNRNRHVDSDFDEGLTQKKHNVKAKKQATEANADAKGVGLGIANAGQPTKRRRMEKATNTAPAMERSASNNASGSNKNRAAATSRGSPIPESRKKAKVAPSPLISSTKRRNGAGGAKSPQLASSPINDGFLDKSSRQEEKQKTFIGDQQEPILAHTLSSVPEGSKNGVLSPTNPCEQIGMMSNTEMSDPKDQQAQLQSHLDSKILSDTTEPERMIEESADGSAATYQRKISHSAEEVISTIPLASVSTTGASSATFPSSSTFSSLPPPPPPLPPASAPPASTFDPNPESDQQLPQQMTTRANRAASVSSKSGIPAQSTASDIVPPPRARNTRNNGQRPASSSRNSSNSIYNDNATDRYNEHVKGSGASTAGSNQSRRSHKKSVGGNGGTSSGRTSRRGSASSHQHHNLPSTETLFGPNTRPNTGMVGTNAASNHSSRRSSAAGHGSHNGDGRNRGDVVSQYNTSNNVSSNNNNSNNGDFDATKHRRDVDDAADGGIVREGRKSTNNVDNDNDNANDDDEEDDADEPRYCYCNQVSYGEMVACDNPHCLREWFHLACVGLSRPPSSKSKWYCNECKDNLRLARPGSSRH